MTLHFKLQPESYAVARLDAGSAIPSWATNGVFFSITATAEELSIICEETRVPAECKASRGWRALALAGPFAFTEIGIAAEFTSVLAAQGISVLVVSTYDTDWLFVTAGQLDAAIRALAGRGHRVER